jgi:NAD(P)-dependent dehydrogenase (short-subunit alcohol dehydrogenase family)
MRLEGKIALITGGASGIGRAIAARFAREGARVIVADRDRDRGTSAVESLLASGGLAEFEPVDVAVAEQVRSLFERVAGRHPTLDVLVPNAGIMICKTLEQTEVADWDAMHAVNLRGMFLTIKYGGPLVRRPGGVIITTGSVDGLFGAAENAAYAASKGGIIAMSRAAALDYAKVGIRLNCICPGWIDTPMNDLYFRDKPEEKDKAARQHPVGRLGTADDIANTALFLATPEASFIVGLAMVVDGGLTVN